MKNPFLPIAFLGLAAAVISVGLGSAQYDASTPAKFSEMHPGASQTSMAAGGNLGVVIDQKGVVLHVERLGAAEAAGIVAGDKILSITGKRAVKVVDGVVNPNKSTLTRDQISGPPESNMATIEAIPFNRADGVKQPAPGLMPDETVIPPGVFVTPGAQDTRNVSVPNQLSDSIEISKDTAMQIGRGNTERGAMKILIAETPVGQALTVTIERDGKSMDVAVTMVAWIAPQTGLERPGEPIPTVTPVWEPMDYL